VGGARANAGGTFQSRPPSLSRASCRRCACSTSTSPPTTPTITTTITTITTRTTPTLGTGAWSRRLVAKGRRGGVQVGAGGTGSRLGVCVQVLHTRCEVGVDWREERWEVERLVQRIHLWANKPAGRCRSQRVRSVTEQVAQSRWHRAGAGALMHVPPHNHHHTTREPADQHIPPLPA